MLAIDWLFARPGRALLVAIASIFAAHFAYVAILIVRDPYLLNYTEGISLMAANRVLRGEPLYPDINRFPFVYFAYPIVYPLVSSALVALLGNRLLGLRLLTIACELLLAVLFFCGVGRDTPGPFPSAPWPAR